jgi:5-formyltetrahydrofolate cyclo-ligase
MQDKASFRKEMIGRRDSIPAETRKIKSRAIEDNLYALEEFIKAETLLLFASFRSETDTTGMIRKALGMGKRVLLPKVEDAALALYRIADIGELSNGYMGIPEPSVLSDDRKAGLTDIDAAIIPGAAFDNRGSRIGYGGGYYDRLLAGVQVEVPVVAVCFEEQIVPAVPSEQHDVRVSVIVTDERVIRVGRQ